LHAWSTPPAPRCHDRSIRAAGPTPSHTPHSPLFTPPTYVARLVQPTSSQMPQSQHSGSWPHPLTDTAHSAFYAAHLRCAPDRAHLPQDATMAAFGQLAPPPHTHRTLRFLRRPPTLHAWPSPPAPRCHDRSIRAAGPTPSQTPQTPLFTPPTYVARLIRATCPQTPRSRHLGSWPHPLTDTTNAAFDAAHLRCTPG